MEIKFPSVTTIAKNAVGGDYVISLVLLFLMEFGVNFMLKIVLIIVFYGCTCRGVTIIAMPTFLTNFCTYTLRGFVYVIWITGSSFLFKKKHFGWTDWGTKKCEFIGLQHPLALSCKTLYIFSKNKVTLDKVSYGSGQKYSKELKNHSFTSVETIVVALQWKMCKNQYFPCFEP